MSERLRRVTCTVYYMLKAISALCALLLLSQKVDGHGAVTIPPPRNSIDADTAPWNGTMPAKIPYIPWCPFPSAAAAGSDPRNLTGSNGQACYW